MAHSVSGHVRACALLVRVSAHALPGARAPVGIYNIETFSAEEVALPAIENCCGSAVSARGMVAIADAKTLQSVTVRLLLPIGLQRVRTA